VGKETQTRMLFDRLRQEGHQLRRITFPDYDSPSSALVKDVLKGAILVIGRMMLVHIQPRSFMP